MARDLIIDGTRIADDTDCWVIAEIGHNHQGSVEKCKALFDAAKEAGASAVKLQKRENRSLYTREAFDRPYDHENSFGATYGEHREALEFGWDEYHELKQYAKELDITFFATAFDVPSVDFLAELDVPAIKIASGDLKSLYLLEYAARLGKPLIVSTGVATIDDVQRAYDTIMPINPQFCLLQCTAAYPPEFDQLDLRVIETFRQRFPDVVIGFSSHDNGIAMAMVAYTLGARVVEKHFTLNRALKGTDHAFSLEPVGMRKLVRDLRRARVAMGTGEKRVHPSEVSAGVKMGKKIVARHDLLAGQVLELKDVAMKSPGDGLSPDHLSDVLGRTVQQPLFADDAVTYDVLD
ncbi:MAG TPA: N-acetylneuraminate synthase family protein [Acidimicrobiales bacterium]|nr:N-acetylneuraminate synthase family protein [Acidimicrobiales bacterium]